MLGVEEQGFQAGTQRHQEEQAKTSENKASGRKIQEITAEGCQDIQATKFRGVCSAELPVHHT